MTSTGCPTSKALAPSEEAQRKSTLLEKRLKEGAVLRNAALSFASDVLRSEAARLDGQLEDDFACLMRGNAVYLPHFVSNPKDMTVYHQLKNEIVLATGATMVGKGGLIEWSRHQVFENPTDISKTFNDIVEMLAEYFDVELYATRLNYYRDGSQWKPQHHDSHAYGGRAEQEDFTMGVTLGADRSLLFTHEASGREFSFPQRNGDCFAFTGAVNQAFTHGVPRVHRPVGDRFSIIAWGRRRTLNERNGGAPALVDDDDVVSGERIQTVEDAIEVAKQLVSNRTAHRPSLLEKEGSSAKPTAQPNKKKNRLQ